MSFESRGDQRVANLRDLTRGWGAFRKVSLYLDRCQVDTPTALVAAAWKHVHELRKKPSLVVDFGAGDGRFAFGGSYEKYIGYEIDSSRCKGLSLPAKAAIRNKCAFSDEIRNADLCVGNPPFVRNQDLPLGWRQRASRLLERRTGVQLSGIANAWQYFFLLALASTKNDGLIALVIPYEWVSRPASRKLREYIVSKRWSVSVYRLVENTFDSVLTTSSITIVDKSSLDGEWRYFEETSTGAYKALASPSGAASGVLPYVSKSKLRKNVPVAKRGLSPGTQKILTFTEGERVRLGLRIGRDVVPCVTTLRGLEVQKIFKHDPSAPDDEVKFDVGPVVFNLPEQIGRGHQLYIAVKGWLSFGDGDLRTLPLKTKSFGTEVGYFRLKDRRLEHVYGAHYDLDESRPGHPVFHAQLTSKMDFADNIRELFNLDFGSPSWRIQ